MKTVAVIAVLFLSACGFTPQGDLARDVVREKGAQAYDEGLENSLWYICNAASVGSVRRRFGVSPEAAAAYQSLCAPSVNVIGASPASRSGS